MEEISSGDYTRIGISSKGSISPAKISTHEFLLLATVLDTNVRLSALVDALEGEVLEIGLHLKIMEFAANETLSVEDTDIDRMR